MTKLGDGYRAVMVIREADNEPKLPAQARMKNILDQIPVPFGLLIAHQYSIGTTSLNGFDALFLAYVESRSDTQMLSVITEFLVIRDLVAAANSQSSSRREESVAEG